MKSLKTKTSNLLRHVPIAGVVIWACAPGVVSAQTPGQITVTRDGSQLTLSWDCVAGRSYQIFSTTDLAVPWEEVATEPKPLVAVGNQLSYAVGVTSETRFYRVAESADTMPAGMVLIPAGTFMMGDSLGDSPENASTEYPVHEVYVSAFYMDQYEVTKALWDEVYTWAVANGYQFDNAGSGKAPDHPVHSVHWYDCVK